MEEIIRLTLGAFATNCYLVKENGHVLIIDPASRMDKILNHISENETVDAILLTHGHFDHIGAVDKLHAHFQCPVYLNENDEELARNEKLNSLAHFHASLHCPLHYLSDGTIKIGNFELTVTEAPGHTAGSILIQYRNHLFTGDVLFKRGIGRTDLYSGNNSAMKNTLRLFNTMDENLLIYPGHDELSVLKEELLYNPYL